MIAQDVFFHIITIIGPLIFAITVHEFSHIAAAKFFGDDLGTRLGRFTLDPLKHIDMLWTIALPAILITMIITVGGSGVPIFAAGKPAPYNPFAFNRKLFGKKISIKNAELLIALAGPFSNFLTGIVSFSIAYFLFYFKFSFPGEFTLYSFFEQFMYLNITLFIFNLIPIPPLDGSKIISAILPEKISIKYEEFSVYFSWLFIFLIIFGNVGIFLQYSINIIASWIMNFFN